MFENLHVPKGSYSGRNSTTIKSDEIQTALDLIARWVKELYCFRYKEDELLNILIETIDRNDKYPGVHIALVPHLYRYTQETFHRWYMYGEHKGARTHEILRSYHGK